MAQVVLENIYKSFPARPGDRQTGSAMVNPSLGTSSNRSIDSPETRPRPANAGKEIQILRHINLSIADGEFMVLVGPSGCGKSTLLRLIAGLDAPTSGSIWVGDRPVTNLPPKARDIAMVFQSYALYPHMTVYENLAFGLRRTRLRADTSEQAYSLTDRLLGSLTRPLPKALHYRAKAEQAIEGQVQQVAQMLELEGLLQRYPKQLSGGQKQRVALGRAMARDPQAFLMDEPLSNLDAKLRAQTRAQIVQLQRQLGTTTIYVTHDQTEAMTMGDRIAVLNSGEIQQIAAPLDLYRQPANRFVAEFIGSPPMNFIEVDVKDTTHLVHPGFALNLPEVWGTTLAPYRNQTVVLGVRPEHFDPIPKDREGLSVQVVLVEALGHETYLACTFADHVGHTAHLQVRTDPQQQTQRGDRLNLSIQTQHIHLFETESGAAIVPQNNL